MARLFLRMTKASLACSNFNLSMALLRSSILLLIAVSCALSLILLLLFVSSRIDNNNSLLYGIGDGLLRRVQLVQNAAARVVTGTGSKITARRCLMTYTAWLLVRQRIIYFIGWCGDDRVQVHKRSGNVISGRPLRTDLTCCLQATSAICQRKDTVASPGKNCYRYRRVCCFADAVWNI